MSLAPIADNSWCGRRRTSVMAGHTPARQARLLLRSRWLGAGVGAPRVTGVTGQLGGCLGPSLGVGWLVQLFGERPESLQMGSQFLAAGGDRVGNGGRRSRIDAPFHQAGVLQFA